MSAERKAKLKKITIKTAVAALWLVLWQLVCYIVDMELLVVSPLAVAKRLWELGATAEFWRYSLGSLGRITEGFLLGSVTGAVLAMVCHKFSFAREFFTPAITLIKSTPVASFIILALVWLTGQRVPVFISFLMVLRQDKMDSIIFWTMGSFASASWTDVAIVAPVVAAGVAVVLYYCRDLNLLLAGSETAQSLGVEVERVKRVLLVTTTLMVAFCVAACGVIGFVGLVVPHCVRLVMGPDNRRVVPCSIFAGGLFMLVCDTLARTVLMPSELPVGSLTAVAGAPLFIYLLYRNKRRI